VKLFNIGFVFRFVLKCFEKKVRELKMIFILFYPNSFCASWYVSGVFSYGFSPGVLYASTSMSS